MLVGQFITILRNLIVWLRGRMVKKNNSNEEKDKKKEIKEAQEKIIGKEKDSKDKKSNSNDTGKEKSGKEKKSLDNLDLENYDEKPLTKENPKTYEIIENLEEAIEKENIPRQILESQYTKELSHEPVQALYDQMNALKESVELKGYLNPNEQKQVEYMVGAIEQKLEDQDAGKYSFTESVAMKASLIHKMGAMLKGSYRANTKEDDRMYKTQ